MSVAFDRFMVHVEVGRNLKLGRLKLPERWTFVAGVLAIAAKAELRGALLVGQTPATAEGVARQADVPLALAASTLQAMRTLGMLDTDDDGVEWVHDFHVYNPPPKRDATSAKRAREYRERQRENRNVTPPSRRDDRDANGAVTAASRGEVEVEVEVEEQPPFIPPRGETPFPTMPVGNRQRERDRFVSECREYASTRFPELVSPNREQLVEAGLREGLSSVETVEAFVRKWAPVSSRSGLVADLGAQVVAFNAAAKPREAA